MSPQTQTKDAPNSESATARGDAIGVGSNDNPTKVNTEKLTILILAIVLSGACLLYYAALTPEKFGAYHDDGIYVTTAKALATGQGYRIISLPYEPSQTKYPPFYPFLLSLIWRVYPQFPQNLIPMMLLSVAATVAFLAITWRYLVKQGYATAWQALIVVSLSALNWRMMILATAVYSEMVYATLSVVGLYIAEKYEKEQKGSAGFALGVVSGLVFLTRSSGVALLIAICVYYVLRRQWRRAILPAAVGGAFVVCWVVWCYLNRTHVEGVNVAYYTNYFRDFSEIVSELQAQSNTSKLMVVLSIIGRNALMLTVISPPVVCLGLDYAWIKYFGFVFVFIAAGFLRQTSKGVRLLHFYIISYLALHIFWMPNVSYDRFVTPLLPFLLLFLITEIERLASLVRRELSSSNGVIRRLSAAFIGLALFLSLGIALYNYVSDLFVSLGSASLKSNIAPPSNDLEAIGWINSHTNPSDVVLCYRDPMYFLYTGRKATRSFAMKAGGLWQHNQSLIFRIITDNNGGYLVSTSSDFENEYQPNLQRASLKALVEQYPQIFVPVFKSTDERSVIYRLENVDTQ